MTSRFAVGARTASGKNLHAERYRRNVMSLRNNRCPCLMSRATRKVKFVDKHARNLYRGLQKRDARRMHVSATATIDYYA